MFSARFVRFGSAKVEILFPIVKKKCKNLFRVGEESLRLVYPRGQPLLGKRPCFVRFGSAKVGKKGALSRAVFKHFVCFGVAPGVSRPQSATYPTKVF